jgi:hypothetical protein
MRKKAAKKEEQFGHITRLIKVGVVKDFDYIFKFTSKTPLAKALKIPVHSFTKKMQNPKLFQIDEIERMAALFKVSFKKMMDIVLKERN